MLMRSCVVPVLETGVHVSPASVVFKIDPRPPQTNPMVGVVKKIERSRLVVPLVFTDHVCPPSVDLTMVPSSPHAITVSASLLQYTARRRTETPGFSVSQF